MTYDAKRDQYLCPDGRALTYRYTSKSISANGYEIQKNVYRNDSCIGCPHREQCHRSKYEQRTVKVSHRFTALRQQSYKNITSSAGVLLRMNRSIQVEGAFGVIKQDMLFRRFLTREKQKTKTQFFLLAIAFNIKKLWNRQLNARLRLKLFKTEAA